MLGNPFSFHGRRGRLSYLLTSLLQAVLSFVLTASISDAINFYYLVIVLPLWGCLVWCAFAISAQRLHDIGASGWWSVLNIVPIANIVVCLLLLFAPGQKFDNLYGPVPMAERPPALPA